MVVIKERKRQYKGVLFGKYVYNFLPAFLEGTYALAGLETLHLVRWAHLLKGFYHYLSVSGRRPLQSLMEYYTPSARAMEYVNGKDRFSLRIKLICVAVHSLTLIR